MVFTNIKKMTSFSEIIVKVKNHKNRNLVKNKPELCGPYKYSINTINKKHLNIPRCRINPKKLKLEKIHVVTWVLL